jgi:hypothetical protein
MESGCQERVAILNTVFTVSRVALYRRLEFLREPTHTLDEMGCSAGNEAYNVKKQRASREWCTVERWLMAKEATS